jgi:hypothetical protein
MSMEKPPPPQAPELKALLAQLESGLSPRQRLRMRAAAMTRDIVARARRQSREKK